MYCTPVNLQYDHSLIFCEHATGIMTHLYLYNIAGSLANTAAAFMVFYIET